MARQQPTREQIDAATNEVGTELRDMGPSPTGQGAEALRLGRAGMRDLETNESEIGDGAIHKKVVRYD